MIFKNYTIDELVIYMEYSLENNTNDKSGKVSNLFLINFIKIYIYFLK